MPCNVMRLISDRCRAGDEEAAAGRGRRGWPEGWDAGGDAVRGTLAEEIVDERLHAELPHAKRILHDDPLQFAVVHGVYEDVTGVEAEELDLAGLAGVLERQQRAGGRRLVRREEAVDLVPVAVEEILGCALGRVARGAGVLVGGNQLDAGMLRQRIDEAFLALFGPEDPLLIAYGGHLPLRADES